MSCERNMELNSYDGKVSSVEEMYTDQFDQFIEQSAIYDDVLFECIGEKVPAIVLTPSCDILHPRGKILITVSALLPASMVLEELSKEKGFLIHLKIT